MYSDGKSFLKSSLSIVCEFHSVYNCKKKKNWFSSSLVVSAVLIWNDKFVLLKANSINVFQQFYSLMFKVWY